MLRLLVDARGCCLVLPLVLMVAVVAGVFVHWLLLCMCAA